jgi:glutathione S-transferase
LVSHAAFDAPRPYLRARVRLWSKAVDETLFEAKLSFSAMFRERMRAMTEEQGRYQNVGDPIKRARLMSTYAEGGPYVFQGIGAFEIAFEKMEKDLKAGGPWLVGANLTLADINMMPFVARMGFMDLLDVWIADRPTAQDWWRRVQALPSFQASISHKTTDEDATAMKTSGARIRESCASGATNISACLRPLREPEVPGISLAASLLWETDGAATLKRWMTSADERADVERTLAGLVAIFPV